MADFGLTIRRDTGPPPDWRRIDEVILANTSLKPWELSKLTVPEAAFLVTAICKKDQPNGSDDPQTVQSKLNEAINEAKLYSQLTLDQKLEIARREIEG
ncbi:hypothetical protein [Zavarzinella formosa]|uniref:hypothetical protein n=1 Tax=Zavarzinella formosa TaxID=360055 RepID=UPI000309A0A9|nr:hypothetical protein [Zavarzinella formosa]